MIIFPYNLYIFGFHLWTVLYPKPCYNEPWYKEVVVYITYSPLNYLHQNKTEVTNEIFRQIIFGSTKIQLTMRTFRKNIQEAYPLQTRAEFVLVIYPVYLAPIALIICFTRVLSSSSKFVTQRICNVNRIKTLKQCKKIYKKNMNKSSAKRGIIRPWQVIRCSTLTASCIIQCSGYKL